MDSIATKLNATVFLGATLKGLQPHHDSLNYELEKRDIEVITEDLTQANRAEARAKLLAAFQKSDVVVQMVGQEVGAATRDGHLIDRLLLEVGREHQLGLEQQQTEAKASSTFQQLLWIPEDVEIDHVDDIPHRMFLRSITNEPPRVFLSYAHASKDAELHTELSKHLRLLEQRQLISLWSDRDISAGDKWHDRIMEELKRSDIALLLVSVDFLNSEFIREQELPIVKELSDAGKARVVPIRLRRCSIKGKWFSELQALPNGAKPVDECESLDAAFDEVAQRIERLIEEFGFEALPDQLGAELFRGTPGEFKDAVLKRLPSAHDLKLPTIRKPMVFLRSKAQDADNPNVQLIRKCLRERHCRIVPFAKDDVPNRRWERANLRHCQGVLIFYGGAEIGWVHDKALIAEEECEKRLAKRRRKKLVPAVYVAPPPPQRQEVGEFDHVIVLRACENLTCESLKPFFKKLETLD